jgi:hypothetical protein
MITATEDKPMPAWATLMQEYYGVYMTASRVHTWSTEIEQPAPVGVGTITDVEIVAAIRFARAKEASGEKHRKKGEATLNDLIMWIRWQRKEERESRRGHDVDTTAGSMDHQKNRMLRAKSWEERWEILCESHYLMCEPIDAWATEYWGNDWVEQRNKRRKEVAACVREVIAVMSHGRAA